MPRSISFTTVANAAMIASSLFVVVTYARVWTTPSAPAAPPRPPSYSVGETLPALPDISYAASEHSLLLFVNSRCHFCTESMPFYRTLAGARNERRSGVRLIALSQEDRQDLEAYLQMYNVTVDATASIAGRSDVKLSATPTLVLLGRTGRVERVWVGALQPNQQQDVLRAVGGQTPAS